MTDLDCLYRDLEDHHNDFQLLAVIGDLHEELYGQADAIRWLVCNKKRPYRYRGPKRQIEWYWFRKTVGNPPTLSYLPDALFSRLSPGRIPVWNGRRAHHQYETAKEAIEDFMQAFEAARKEDRNDNS